MGRGHGRNPGSGMSALQPFKALVLTTVWSLLDEELKISSSFLKDPCFCDW